MTVKNRSLYYYGRYAQDCTVGSGASLSDPIVTGRRTLAGIQMPAAWTTANLTFQGSADGTTFYDLFNDSDEVVVGASAQRLVGVPESVQAVFDALASFKLRSGTSASAVAQTADRTIKLIFK